MGAVNFPQVQLQARPLRRALQPCPSQRARHAGRLNEVFLQRDIKSPRNIWKPTSEIGYVVLDADLAEQSSPEILDEIRALDGTIRARLIYKH